MTGTYSAERCTWCGADIDADDGFRAYEPSGERRAAFCRLEHLVPWRIQGSVWEAGELEPGVDAAGLRECSQCGAELGEVSVVIVRRRGRHRIADGFCSVEHMADWAKAGGRWQ